MGGLRGTISRGLSSLARWRYCGFDWASRSCFSFLTACDWGGYLLAALNSSAQLDNSNKMIKRAYACGTRRRISIRHKRSVTSGQREDITALFLLSLSLFASPLPFHSRNVFLIYFSSLPSCSSLSACSRSALNVSILDLKDIKLNLKLLIICSQERHYRSIPVMLRAFVFCFAVLDEWISKCPESLKINTEI